MDGHVTSVNDCKRQGVGLYWSWRSQRDPATDARISPRHVGGDVTQRFHGDDGGSKIHRPDHRRSRPAVHRLDPLGQQQQQHQRLPRQRRRHRNQSRDPYGIPVTSSHGGVTSPLALLTPVHRRLKLQNVPPLWSKSCAAGHADDWNLSDLLQSSAGMSCIQLQLIEQQHSISVVQVRVTCINTGVSVVQVRPVSYLQPKFMRSALNVSLILANANNTNDYWGD